ncbi:hypothetical protein MRB53_001532 [Persea americana]|uniref:Uncharacterized protein n=1 Tax=Persea americana TaxID=3435 RepID=A0ACC2MSY5_PERAE|nr:hypothetical protein MRB53_001532 [Persea americana]
MKMKKTKDLDLRLGVEAEAAIVPTVGGKDESGKRERSDLCCCCCRRPLWWCRRGNEKHETARGMNHSQITTMKTKSREINFIVGLLLSSLEDARCRHRIIFAKEKEDRFSSSAFLLKNGKREEPEDCWAAGSVIDGKGRLLPSTEARTTETPPVASLARSKKEQTKGSHLPCYGTITGERNDLARFRFQVKYRSSEVDLVLGYVWV